MHEMILPVLLAAVIATSNSSIIPGLSRDTTKESPDINSYIKQHILRERLENKDILSKLLCTDSQILLKSDVPKICRYFREKLVIAFENTPHFYGNQDNTISKDGNYDDKGFHKEQWHNYPRQLDRLPQETMNHVKRVKEFQSNTKSNPKYYERNNLYSNILYKLKDIHETEDDTPEFPLPLLKFGSNINLFNSDDYSNNSRILYLPRKSENDYDDNIDASLAYLNPSMNNLKYKRNYLPSNSYDYESKPTTERDKEELHLPIKKRLFSLMSRLQSLSHRGHELMHRRHLHSLYFPDHLRHDLTLTAETRAFMRPPGSPLRWG